MNNKPVQDDQPITQEKSEFRKRWPQWMKELPRLNFPPLDPQFQLISESELRSILKDTAPEIVEQIITELNEIENYIMDSFRERDHEAKLQQNAYRLYQLGYMTLATAATFVGSLQALSFGSNPDLVALFAFFQTIIAGFAVFISLLGGQEPPFPRWMDSRRIAEFLRREYFRYLVGLAPYDNPTLKPYERKRMLKSRAAGALNNQFEPED